jgi:AraC family transcriptional regulator
MYMIELLLLRLIATAGRRVTEQQPAWVSLLNAYLHEHTDAPTSLAGLATLAGLHPVTLSRQFPRYFSCTLGEYKRKLKIERSLSLIKKTGTSLTDVAYDCGFYDQVHFTRNFKALNGILPKAFRNLYLQCR